MQLEETVNYGIRFSGLVTALTARPERAWFAFCHLKLLVV
jgi:hypothetical protein